MSTVFLATRPKKGSLHSEMPEILLATLNAKYLHSSFGLRYLMANLGPLQSRAAIAEYDINQRPIDILESILAVSPRIVGLGVYIWNANETLEVVTLLRRLRPELLVVLGGPEVSYESSEQEITGLADYVVAGEADIAFATLCQALLSGNPPRQKVIQAALPELPHLQLPYSLYTDDDIRNRVLYVEASRGCPFTCEFCLSSLDIPVRQFPIEPFLRELDLLLARGALQFKFVDRTFNLNLSASTSILRFFLERLRPGLFVHFEMIPDRLPEALRTLIAQFPTGSIQLEVGVQTFDESVARNISRRQDFTKLEENFRFLRQHTGVHIHADLIAGLPGETLGSFAEGFDRLVGLGPQEIQVGILKRLRGTPIVRHDREWGMVYSPMPPYEILQNKLMNFSTLQQLRRFSRYWDLVGNSGNFVETTPLIWAKSGSPFISFLRFSDWLFQRTRRTHGIALNVLSELLFEFLATVLELPKPEAATTLWKDFQRVGRLEVPPFLNPFLTALLPPRKPSRRNPGPPRQTRHLALSPQQVVNTPPIALTTDH